jgi:holo-[acyl-carrier protein] synthase
MSEASKRGLLTRDRTGHAKRPVRALAVVMVDIAKHGVGIDLIEVERVRERLERRPTLEERIFTEPERRYAHEQRDPAQHLAARFCAKEAVVKALALEAFEGHEIELVGRGEEVSVSLKGQAERRAADLGVRVLVSMSHLGSIACAIALAVPAASDEPPS